MNDLELRKKAQAEVAKNYEYFVKNFDELYSKYQDKYLVLKDKKVVADYITFDDAHNEAKKRYGSGNYSIQYCNLDELNGIFFNNDNISFGKAAI